MRPPNRREIARLIAVAVPSLAVATLVVLVLERYVGVPSASAVYLIAVVATALYTGTPGAVVASIAAFVLYDFLFIEPYYTLTINDPSEWLSVILLLFVGVVVGQLTALLRTRAVIAEKREREARTLFQVSRALATRESTPAVLPAIAATLAGQTTMHRVWIALGADEARERVAADTGSDPRPAPSALHRVLRRMPGDVPAQWIRVHQPAGQRTRPGPVAEIFRVRIEVGSTAFGSIWALRDRGISDPDRTETRLLAAAADQVGQALALDRMAAESQAAEIARQADAIKSALLQSVSHDLRTPLATIRAAAGTLRPDAGLSPQDQQESAEAIDREVEYLNRLVTNLLDLSRIEAGALRADRDVFHLDDLLATTIERIRPRLDDRPLAVELASAPPVEVDPVFLDEAVTNALDNAVKYTPPGTPMRIVAAPLADGSAVRLTIEDAGPGVPDELLPRIFEKFYRVPGLKRSSRSGTGIGLAVTQGLVEAMGGHVSARHSELGGLAIDLDLPLAPLPAHLARTPLT
jgi:two-component system sensor histidine kinase KdpD